MGTLRNFRFGEINAWINVLRYWTPIIYFGTKPVLKVLDKENNSINKKQNKAQGLKVHMYYFLNFLSYLNFLF